MQTGAMAVPADDRPHAPILTFLGGTGTVTGSRFLVDTPDARVLVDCGMYQGPKELRLRNWEPFPVDPATIDAIVLTHAHVDHCGFVPALTVRGFTGPVYASDNTADLAGIVLPDSGHLQEEEARYANLKGYSKHHPARALYTEADARAALRQLRRMDHGGEVTTVAPGIGVSFRHGGHILGSSIVTMEIDAPGGPRRVTFSGDLGRPNHPLLNPPQPLDGADIVLCESTYGDRVHDDSQALERFADAVRRTAARGGVVVIPAFAVDRTEILLVHLRQLRAGGAIPDIPIFVDSPMALAALDVYQRAITDRDPEIRPEVIEEPDVFGRNEITEVHEVEGSMKLDALRSPAIIISASGMATGGRVLHHLDRYLPDRKASVILVGFQAANTRGRLLADGARQVKLLGRYVRVRAEVVDLPSFSVHADRSELLAWLGADDIPPEVLYVVHGEPGSSASLCQAVIDELDWNAVVPAYGERVRLD